MYGKLFSQMYESSLVEDWQALVTFQQFVILCDRDGVVDMTLESIARRTNIPIDVLRRGVEVLSAPDARSRTPDEEGRRIVLLDDHRDWGWRIVNHRRYRDLGSAEDKRAADRERQRKKRAEKRAASKASQECREVSHGVAEIAYTDTDTDTDTDANTDCSNTGDSNSAAPKVPMRRVQEQFDAAFDAFWSVVHRKVGRRPARKAFENAARRLVKEGRFPRHGLACEFLTEVMIKYRETPDARPSDRNPIHPATWLNQARYDDDPAEWSKVFDKANKRQSSVIDAVRRHEAKNQERLQCKQQKRLN